MAGLRANIQARGFRVFIGQIQGPKRVLAVLACFRFPPQIRLIVIFGASGAGLGVYLFIEDRGAGRV